MMSLVRPSGRTSDMGTTPLLGSLFGSVFKTMIKRPFYIVIVLDTCRGVSETKSTDKTERTDLSRTALHQNRS
jgi:hypothetical protein